MNSQETLISIKTKKKINVIQKQKLDLPPVTKDYFDLQKEQEEKYGENTICLSQNGSFFEIYEIEYEDGSRLGNSRILDGLLKQMDVKNDYNGYIYDNKIIKKIYRYGFNYNPDSKIRYIDILLIKGYYVVCAYQDAGMNPITGTKTRSIQEIFTPTFRPSVVSGEDTNAWFGGVILTYHSLTDIDSEMCVINPVTRTYHYRKGSTIGYGIPTIINAHDLHSVFTPNEITIWKKYSGDLDIKDEDNNERMRILLGLSEKTRINYIERKIQKSITNEDKLNEILIRKCIGGVGGVQPSEEIPQVLVKTFTLLHSMFPEAIDNKKYRDDIRDDSYILKLENQSLNQLNIIVSQNDRMRMRKEYKSASVIGATDNTLTIMGKNTHEKWITSPSTKIEIINERIGMGRYFAENEECLIGWMNGLKQMKDIRNLFSAKILGGIRYQLIWDSYFTISKLIECYNKYGLKYNNKGYPINTEILNNFIDLIKGALVPPEELYNQGNTIGGSSYNSFNEPYDIEFPFKKEGCSVELWEIYERFYLNYKIFEGICKHIEENEREIIKEYQDGRYYIYVKPLKTKKRVNGIPVNGKYIEKLELVNCKEGGDKKSRADGTMMVGGGTKILINDRGDKIDYETFIELLGKTRLKMEEMLVIEWLKWCNNLKLKYEDSITETTILIGIIDATQSAAQNVLKYDYCWPTIKMPEKSSYIKVKELRHPLIEKQKQNTKYIPNDMIINENNRGQLIFGHNSVGKSSFMKSLGIAVILGQAGLSVPAENVEIGIYSSLFTRIIGSDDLFRGLSTGTIEMSELNSIINKANHRSLVLGDELCSGTEDNGATSIVAAAMIDLIEKDVSFIFATHLHRLRDIPHLKDIPNLKWKHLEVKTDPDGVLVMTRKILEGAGPRGYAIEIMENLGGNPSMLSKAREIRQYITSEEFALYSARKYNENQKSTDSYKTSWNPKANIQSICQICNQNPTEETDHINERNKSNSFGGIKGVGNVHHGSNLVGLCKDCHYKKTNGEIIIKGYEEYIKEGISERRLIWTTPGKEENIESLVDYCSPEQQLCRRTEGSVAINERILKGEQESDCKDEIIIDTNLEIIKRIIRGSFLRGETDRQIQSKLRQNCIIKTQKEIRDIKKMLL
jgi:DNA mismatch repair protein MutS